MTGPTDPPVPAKFLSQFVHFLRHFYRFIINNCKYWSLFRKCMKIRYFLLFTIIYPTLPFFHSEGNLPVFRKVLKIMFRGLQIALPHNFNKRMLIIS